MYTYVYIYIYTERERDVCTYTYIYIYIYIYAHINTRLYYILSDANCKKVLCQTPIVPVVNNCYIRCK